MKKNMGALDRGLRLGAALIIAALYTLDVINGVVATILGVIAVVFVVTSFVSFCPAYLPFNISTREEN